MQGLGPQQEMLEVEGWGSRSRRARRHLRRLIEFTSLEFTLLFLFLSLSRELQFRRSRAREDHGGACGAVDRPDSNKNSVRNLRGKKGSKHRPINFFPRKVKKKNSLFFFLLESSFLLLFSSRALFQADAMRRSLAAALLRSARGGSSSSSGLGSSEGVAAAAASARTFSSGVGGIGRRPTPLAASSESFSARGGTASCSDRTSAPTSWTGAPFFFCSRGIHTSSGEGKAERLSFFCCPFSM